MIKQTFSSFRGSSDNISPQNLLDAFEYIADQKKIPKPISIYFSLIQKCNAKCSHCKQWTWVTNPNQKDLSLRQISKLFSIFKAWGTKTITLGGGEPFLHPEITNVIKLAKLNNIGVGITTSGTFISDNIINCVLENCDWMRISLDGPNETICDSIRGTGIYEKVYNSIKTIQTIRQDCHSTLIGINFVIQKRNIQSCNAMIDFARANNFSFINFKVPHGFDSSYQPTDDQWKDFLKWLNKKNNENNKNEKLKTNLHELKYLLSHKIYSVNNLLQGKPVKSFYKENKIKCFAPLFSLTCSPSGDIYPCDYLYYDTRSFAYANKAAREKYKIGNLLKEEPNSVLSNLGKLFKSEIWNYPSIAFDECGACTRFCQFNAGLTRLFDKYIKNKNHTIELLHSNKYNPFNKIYL